MRMGIVFCGIVPHPPIMVPEVGGAEAKIVKATQDSLLELGRRMGAAGTETMVIISPHGPVFRDVVALNTAARVYGDLGRFRAPGVKFDLETDRELAARIAEVSRSRDFPVTGLGVEAARQYDRFDLLKLDHGVTAPLYWLQKGGFRGRVVVVGMSLLPRETLYTFGKIVRQAAEELDRKVALVASGDLSHRVTPDGPAGYTPRGAEFDHLLTDLIRKADTRGVMGIDERLAEDAGECGLRAIIMMLGALDGRRWKGDVLSYEAPFGVGYMVAELRFRAGDGDAGSEARSRESFLVRLARQRLENYVRGGRGLPDVGEVPPEFRRPGGTFVTIKKDGVLRGCIGTILPTRSSIAEEVMENAIAAGVRDPRFAPVGPEELEDLEYSVDVLGEPEPVAGPEALDPEKYGVIVTRGNRRGVLLPDLEGIDTAAKQVAIARQKAGIAPHEKVELERFTVTRYSW